MKKQVKKHKKVFRLNVVITYWDKTIVDHFRQPLHEMMKNLAWLHLLDYEILIDQVFGSSFDCGDSELNKGTEDLIYLRSTDNTRIGARDLRHIISCIFDKSILSCLVVEINFQPCKYLPEFPFPKIFYRPLNFPFVEKHGVGEPALYIHEPFYNDLLDSEIDSSMN